MEPEDTSRAETAPHLRERANRIRQFAFECRDGDPAIPRLTDLADELEERAAQLEAE